MPTQKQVDTNVKRLTASVESLDRRLNSARMRAMKASDMATKLAEALTIAERNLAFWRNAPVDGVDDGVSPDENEMPPVENEVLPVEDDVLV